MYKLIALRMMRACIVIILLCIGYFLLKWILYFAFPFLLAILIAFSIHPIVTLKEKKLKIPRPIGTIITIISALMIILGIFFLITLELIQGSIYLAENLPTYYHTFISMFNDFLKTKIIPLYEQILAFIQTLNPTQQAALHEYVEHFTDNIATKGATLLELFFMKMTGVLSFLPESLTSIIFIFLATFFITNDWVYLVNSSKKVIPKQIHSYLKHVSTLLKGAFLRYLKAQLILLFISTCIIFIGLSILNIKHTLTITFFAVLADIMPFIGTGLIFIPWIFYLFLTGSYELTIGISFLYMTVVLSRQILEPKIVSSSIGIHPLLGLILLFISIQLWGVAGILISPIIYILVHVCIQAQIIKHVWQFIKG